MGSPENQVSSSCAEGNPNKMETSEEICQWLAILWERGFCHDNPQVRCLIMQSFLGIASENYENLLKSVPEEFILGPLMQGLNDPVHHKDFGLKGIYSSRTICSAAKFLCQYCSYLDGGKQIKFLCGLALLSKKHSFGRPGLVCFAECIAAAAHGVQQHDQVFYSTGNFLERDKANLLDLFRFIIESSKQHFNASYRLQVCMKILDAAASVMSPVYVPLEILLHFISSLPREFTDFGGSLRMKIQKWLLMWNEEHFTSNQNLELSKSLASFPGNFGYCHPACVTYNDEDVEKWDCEARRWARVIFLVLKEEQDLNSIFSFIQDSSFNLCKGNNLMEWVPVKYFIIISSLIQELQVIQEKIAEGPWRKRMKTDHCFPIVLRPIDFVNGSILLNNISKLFLSIIEESVSFAKSSSSIFWSCLMGDESILPGSVRGRLGGPSQRRLSSSATTSVLEAITSLKSIASISRWCVQFRSESHVLLDSALIFLWSFCWKVIKSPLGRSESEAEICLASYEAMAHVLKELVPAVSSSSLDLIIDRENLSNINAESENFLDLFVQDFLQNVNCLLAADNLVRTRRAILMNWKWICLESLLSIPKFVLKNENGVYMGSYRFFFSDNTVTWIFNDLVDNLENAGEVSVLPILRSVRLIIELFASGRMGTLVSSCNGLNPQMMWDLVNPCWILHVNCNKRRVAPIAALLSSVLHHSVFSDERMHEFDDAPGPLKWFINEILEEGIRSPRTIRLAALHLTGLWLRNPTTIKYYMNELKLLTLYGSVAFDEDFEAELAENQDAKSEVSTLAQSPDPELTEEFINTELYARVSVAVLFNKLADMADLVGSIEGDKDENSLAALASGKTFLLELLHSAVDDKDLSKELYKKYSAIHRRKVRVWQMICILSRFIDQDILEKVTCSLHKALQRNNLPSVRQYLETFAIQIYLKFPFLVGEELVPLLRDYDIKPQALSSYVFVAANVILHAAKPIQSRHLNELLPSIIPLLTSHHHTLRGFAQLLVHQILQKLLHARNSDSSMIMSLEKRCLMDLESYLMCNPDCARLRASMKGYLDAFDPDISVTPAGIFTNRVEESEFECVSKTLMDQVIHFLNDARDDLRCSMAKDAATIKNESLQINDNTNHIRISGDADQEKSPILVSEDVTLDFQKKFTLCKHEMQATTSIFTEKKESFGSFTDIDQEDQLLDHLLHSRSLAVQKLRESRQHFVLVASLIDRIPNLAGLARTCEVFRAAGLTIADKNVLSDKQFQLISVTAEKWVPITEVPVSTMKVFLQKKKHEGFAILGLEQTMNSIPLDQYAFPRKTVLVLGREKEGIPPEIIHILDACVEIPQLGVVRSLNVHVSGAIALWEYTRQQRSQ